MSDKRTYYATLSIKIIAESDDQAKEQLHEIVRHQVDQNDNRCMAISLVKMNDNGIGYKDIMEGIESVCESMEIELFTNND